MSSNQTHGDGWNIPPMIEVTDPGHIAPPIKAPSVGMRRVAYVKCPLGAHQTGVVNDGVHVRYATHHIETGGGPVLCRASWSCTAQLPPTTYIDDTGKRAPQPRRSICACRGEPDQPS